MRRISSSVVGVLNTGGWGVCGRGAGLGTTTSGSVVIRIPNVEHLYDKKDEFDKAIKQ